jgi:hypothetical protein
MIYLLKLPIILTELLQAIKSGQNANKATHKIEKRSKVDKSK